MTPSEYGDRLYRRIQQIEESGEVVLLAAGTAISEMSKRIFEKGQNAAGGTARYESTKPVYIPDSVSPRGGNNTGKTGNPIKTSYYSSYSAFKSAIDRNPGKVIYWLSGELKSDFLNASTADTNTPNLSVQNGFVEIRLKNPKNVEKRRDIDRKYGNVFDVNQAERNAFYNAVDEEFARLLETI